MKFEIKLDVDELDKILDNAFEDVETNTEKAAKECASEGVNILKATSPKGRSGDYANGWAYEKSPDMDEGYTVWNPKHYQLTHLLEKGHVIMNQWGGPYGKGRTKANHHIRNMEKTEVPKFLSKIMNMKFR